jgi:hypothetical protein
MNDTEGKEQIRKEKRNERGAKMKIILIVI